MNRTISRLALCLMMLMIATTTVHASEVRPTSTGATKIHVEDIDPVASLSQVLVGSGVEGIEPTRTMATAGGSIYWVKTREKIDERGHRHVFYRQMYAPARMPGSPISSPADLGVELDGADLGLHYDDGGSLWFVYGTQFEDMVNISTPNITAATHAYTLVQARAAEETDFAVADAGAMPTEVLAADLEKTRLILRSTGDGRTFRYEWRIPTRNAEGLLYNAKLDAETGALLSPESGLVTSACSYDSNNEDSAIGVSQRGANRSVWATEETTRGEDYTHEAHKVSSGSNPHIQVLYRDVDEEDDCDWDGGERYALMPIKTISSQPKYEDYTSPDVVPGRAGADAMHFTYLTMATFDSLGRNGWDANILVAHDEDSNTACPNGLEDISFFNHDQWWAHVPEDAVIHCQQASESYNEAAAIDIVAHEWGHGVAFTDVGWEDSGERQYQEAWADVIGHIVEWANQTAGSGAEQADWEFGEDRGSAWRVADDYASRVCAGSQCESFHASDPEAGSSSHALGNRLSVAFQLMCFGGENTICDDYDYLDGCGTDVTNAGVPEASQILFTVLTNYASDSSDWDDFANYARTAAFAIFADCPYYDAYYEQMSAIEAFTAIGHPPDYGFARWCN